MLRVIMGPRSLKATNLSEIRERSPVKLCLFGMEGTDFQKYLPEYPILTLSVQQRHAQGCTAPPNAVRSALYCLVLITIMEP